MLNESCRAEVCVATAAAYRKPKLEVRPQGYGATDRIAPMSPRKKRIVDWRDAQPSAVLPAGFRQTAGQVCRAHGERHPSFRCTSCPFLLAGCEATQL